MKVALLGPQHSHEQVGRVLKELGVKRRVTLVTAGWQEREADDAELVKAIGVPVTNLRLHARSEEVFAGDAPFISAYKARQELLRHLQGFYRLRLDYTDDAARAISVRHVEPELLEQEWHVSVEQLRQLDRDHIERCRSIHAEFEKTWPLAERPLVARHRGELRTLIDQTEALVIAGGHVASLLNRLKLFDVLHLAAKKHVVAWSAGAMVLTERIVLFHDYPPYGKDIAQVLDAGFGLAKGLVVLPDPKRRVRLDDRAGISRFAQRMAPASCVAMDHGAHLLFERGKLTRHSVLHLGMNGEVQPWSAA